MNTFTSRRPVIQVSGFRKTYGRTVAVDDVSFEGNDGEIFGLIGPNGAGKTTTMECVEDEGASHHRFLRASWQALEGLPYAKRVYEKTASRRLRDARQELHNAEGPPASQR